MKLQIGFQLFPHLLLMDDPLATLWITALNDLSFQTGKEQGIVNGGRFFG
jgi:hypothetical protein